MLFLFSMISVGHPIEYLPGIVFDCVNCLVSSVIGIFLTHHITVKRLPFSVQIKKLAANLLCYSIVIVLMFAIFGRMNMACVIGLFLTSLLATVNHYVYLFKGTEFAATDFAAIGTAANVAKNYQLKIERNIIISWCLFVLFSVVELTACSVVYPHGLVVRIVSVLIEMILLGGFFFVTRNVKGTHWQDEGSKNYGYFLNFLLGAKALLSVKPKNYSVKRINAVAASNAQDEQSGRGKTQDPLPDIIVILNESFADFGVIGDCLTPSIPVTPYFDKIKEESIHGTVLSSVIGGSTANTEYEFLTGNTMAWFPYGMIPLQQYVRGKTYSFITELKKKGYHCVATHPFLASGFSRPTAYPALGFDEIEFIEAYPQKKLVRSLVSDEEMYEHIISIYEDKAKQGQVFIYGVTIQNHGGYGDEQGKLQDKIRIKECPGKYPDAEQYLTLLHISDNALQKLFSYFSSIDREVVICFFGDHMPSVDPEFMKALHGGSFQGLEEKQSMMEIPFLIWNNKGIKPETIERTSFNYLAAHLLQEAGIEASPYFRFLRNLEKRIPAINANGYYCSKSGRYYPIESPDKENKALLDDYRMLIYNSAVDRKHRNETFFPEWK